MTNATSEKLNRLVLAIIAIGVVHVGEELMFGIEEFYKFRDFFAGWYTLFPADRADHASMLLLTLVLTLISLMFYGLMRGGVAALIVVGALGGVGLKEIHHWIDAYHAGGYVSGLVTSVPYVAAGLLIKIEVSRAFKALRRQHKTRRTLAAAAPA